MNSLILDCPHCAHRFPFQQEGEIPERIVCPGCGKESHCNDFSAMMFCPSCRSKLAVPLEMLDGNAISCPHCEFGFLPETTSLMAEGSTAVFEEDTGSNEEPQIFADGEYFDNYRIIRLLGKGGMAEVYLAEHLLLRRLCALKLMRPSFYDSNPHFLKRFIREAKITHKIKHPNIVTVYDVGSDAQTGYLFISMEYLDGKSLLETAREKVLSERELLDMALDMASALSALEAEKVVHRDIKPSNIMFSGDGTLKLMDLGVAKAESDKEQGEITLTMAQTSIGTPSYASPEQCESAHDVDIRSDIYCLGATLYHAASGHVPFGGGTPFEIMLKVLREEPVPLENYRKDLSAPFLALINDMMKKDPAGRPASTSILEKRVRECIHFLEHPEELQIVSAMADIPPVPQYRKNAVAYDAGSPAEAGVKNGQSACEMPLPPPPSDELTFLKKAPAPPQKPVFVPVQENAASQTSEQEMSQKEKTLFSLLLSLYTGKFQNCKKRLMGFLEEKGILVLYEKIRRSPGNMVIAAVVVIVLLTFIIVIANLAFSQKSVNISDMEQESFSEQAYHERSTPTVIKKRRSADDAPVVESVRNWYSSGFEEN